MNLLNDLIDSVWEWDSFIEAVERDRDVEAASTKYAEALEKLPDELRDEVDRAFTDFYTAREARIMKFMLRLSATITHGYDTGFEMQLPKYWEKKKKAL